MKKVLAILLFGSLTLSAQELPQPSPSASLTQRVGLTDITVDYSRPGVKGREIFGDLVPFENLWRTGANKATAISFNTPVMFGENKVEAGTYSIFTIPGESTWVIILNKNTELWGTDGYDEEMDVLRMEVAAMDVKMTETFTIDFQNIMDGKAEMLITWANQQVSIPLEVDVAAKAKANIEVALRTAEKEDLWRVNRNAAVYYSRNNIDQEKAMKFINTSLELNPKSWYSMLVKAEVMYNSGNAKEAIKMAKESMEMGIAEAEANDQKFQYTDLVEGMIENWSTNK